MQLHSQHDCVPCCKDSKEGSRQVPVQNLNFNDKLGTNPRRRHKEDKGEHEQQELAAPNKKSD